MKRSLVLLVLVPLLLLAGLFVWLGTTDGGPAQESSAAEPAGDAADPGARPAAAGHELSAPRDGAGDEHRTGASAETRAAVPGEAEDAREAFRLPGSVVLPSGCGRAEGLEVFLLSRDAGANELVRLSDREYQRALNDEFPPAFDETALGVDEDDEDDGEEGELRILARAAVDEQGRFDLAVPAGPERTGHLLAKGPLLYTWRARKVALRPGATVTLYAECGATLAGRIALPEGAVGSEDLSQVEIALHTSMEGFTGMPTGNRNTRRFARADAQGSFVFEGLPTDGDFMVEVFPDRFAAVKRKVPAPGPGESVWVDIALHRGASVRGKVVDEGGAPLGGARVEGQLPGELFGFDNRCVRITESSLDGSFVLAGLPEGPVVVRAELEGRLDSKDARVELAKGQEMEGVVLELGRGSRITGRLTWSDGQTAAGIEVRCGFDRAHLMGMTAMAALRGASATDVTDAEGRFELEGLGKGPFRVRVEAEAPLRLVEGSAFAADRARAEELAGGPARLVAPDTWRWRAQAEGVQPGAELELVLVPPIGVAGSVVDHEGRPVPEFKVRLAKQSQTMFGAIGLEQQMLPFENQAGVFFVPGLFEGAYKLFVTAEGFAASEPVELALPRGDRAEPIVVALEPSASLKGVVRSPFGSAVADAEVRVGGGQPAWMAALGGQPEPSVHTDGQGRFVLEDLRAGKLSLVATSRSFARSLPLTVEVAAGDAVEGLELVLREGGRIRGEVYDTEGKPAAGMRIQLTNMESFDGRSLSCDGDGRFLAEHVDPGPWQVAAMPAGLTEALTSSEDESSGLASWLKDMRNTMTDVYEGEEAHVVLGRLPDNPVVVSGTVTHGGEPYAGALVSFYAEGSATLESNRIASVDPSGRFEITLERAGDYIVVIQKISGSPGEQNTIEFTITVSGEHSEHDFEIPTGRISGRVRGPDGKPATKVRVNLRPSGGTPSASLFGTQFVEWATDGEGRFDLKGLRPGTYTLAVGGAGVGSLFGGAAPHARAARHDLVLREGQWLQDVDFKLEPAGEIAVEVVDESGEPAGGASVFVRDGDGRLIDRFSWLTADGSGKASVTGLAEGSYTVEARSNGRVPAEGTEVLVRAGETVKARVVLTPGAMLFISAQDEEDQPVRATFSVEDQQGREWSGMISLSELAGLLGQGGLSLTEQRIGPVPPGRYRVTATTSDGRSGRRTLTVAAGKDRNEVVRVRED